MNNHFKFVNLIITWSLKDIYGKYIHLSAANSLAGKNNKSYKSKYKNNNSNQIEISSLTDGKGFNLRKFRNINFPKEYEEDKKFIFKGKSNILAKKLSSEGVDPEEFIKYEKQLDIYARNQSDYHEKQIQDDIRKRRRVKLAIIKKKMNQMENGPDANRNLNNLLTWDAKEQIKYLNLNEPEVWSVEKICDTFPITEESCRKLLKSKWAPRTLDELCRHDEFVLENWKRLANEENIEPGGPAINVYEELKKQNKINLMKYAAGIPEVYFERKAQVFSDSYSIHQTLLAVGYLDFIFFLLFHFEIISFF
jgi:hypothetical protein